MCFLAMRGTEWRRRLGRISPWLAGRKPQNRRVVVAFCSGWRLFSLSPATVDLAGSGSWPMVGKHFTTMDEAVTASARHRQRGVGWNLLHHQLVGHDDWLGLSEENWDVSSKGLCRWWVAVAQALQRQSNGGESTMVTFCSCEGTFSQS